MPLILDRVSGFIFLCTNIIIKYVHILKYILKYIKVLMYVQVISIDCGRSTCKAISGNARSLIPSIVGESRDLKIGDYGDYNVVINGNNHFVGELAERESRFRREMVSRSKIHDDTAILTLTAVALLADPRKSIKLVTGLPVEQHDKVTKQSYIDLLSGYHIITVNGITHELQLHAEDIAISIEGGGAYWTEPVKGRCYVIDLGSRTINAVCVQQNRFRDVDSLTLNYGCIELGNASEDPNDLVAQQLVTRIYADLSRRWLDIGNSPVLLTGGGALLLEHWLRKCYQTARIVADPVWANAIGYYKLGMMKWAKS